MQIVRKGNICITVSAIVDQDQTAQNVQSDLDLHWQKRKKLKGTKYFKKWAKLIRPWNSI